VRQPNWFHRTTRWLGAGGFLGRGFFVLSGGDAEASNAALRFVSARETNRRYA